MGFFSSLFDTPKVELDPSAGVIRRTTTPGADISTAGDVVSLTPSAARDVAVRGLAESGFAAGRDIRGLREKVTPGFGALTESRVSTVRGARDRALGNLRENIARRKIAGSSFASDALTRAEAEFSKQEADVRAQSVLEELDLTRRLITDESEVRTKSLLSQLSQMNFETELVNQFSTTISGIQQRNAEAQFLAAQKAAADRGAFREKAFGFGGRILGAGAGFALGGPAGAALGAKAGGELGSLAAGL